MIKRKFRSTYPACIPHSQNLTPQDRKWLKASLERPSCLPRLNPVEMLSCVHRPDRSYEGLVVKGWVPGRPPLSRNCHSVEAGSSAGSQTFGSLTSRFRVIKKKNACPVYIPSPPPRTLDPRMFGFTRRSSLRRFCVVAGMQIAVVIHGFTTHINRYVEPSSIPVLSQR